MWQSGEVALWQPKDAYFAHNRREVIFEGRSLRHRGHENTARADWGDFVLIDSLLPKEEEETENGGGNTGGDTGGVDNNGGGGGDDNEND